MNDEEFFTLFETQSLTHSQWDHRAHLKVAYLHLLQWPLSEALARVRSGIKKLNAAHGVADTPTRGYHETMTVAWLHLVHVTLCQFGPADTADAFLDAQSQLGSRRALLLFYSRDLIMSPEAKASFVPPDLADLPRPLSSSIPTPP